MKGTPGSIKKDVAQGPHALLEKALGGRPKKNLTPEQKKEKNRKKKKRKTKSSCRRWRPRR